LGRLKGSKGLKGSKELTDLRRRDLPPLASKYAADVREAIFSDDAMVAGDEDQYFRVGASALNCVLAPLFLSTTKTPEAILDFGSGAGRVTRWFRAAFPAASLYACDIRSADLDFVKETFDATIWESGTDVGALQSPARYDLIWVGSVFTHLSEAVSAELMDKLVSWLKPSGILVLSSHGRFAAAQSATHDYGLGDRMAAVLRDYESSGFGYADYEGQDGYGISVIKSVWWIREIEKRIELKLVCLSEMAWDQHHDVVAIQKKKLAGLDKGSFDIASATPGSRDAVLSGWAVAESSEITAVELINVDGDVRRATHGLPRPDVAAFLARPEAGNAGWELRIPGASTWRGLVRVRAVLANGDVVELGSKVVLPLVSSIEAPADDEDVRGDAVTTSGWALGIHSPVSKIRVLVEGKEVASLPLATSRPELRETYPDIGPEPCGWHGLVPLARSSTSKLSFVAVLEDGSEHPVGDRTVRSIAG
jgi:SAM-dependent methyltransferase